MTEFFSIFFKSSYCPKRSINKTISITNRSISKILLEREKKCEHSQLGSMDWCGERPLSSSFTPYIL